MNATKSSRILIQVTEDGEQYTVVDIAGLSSPTAIKEQIAGKMGLDSSSISLHPIEIGDTEPGKHVNNRVIRSYVRSRDYRQRPNTTLS